MTHRHARASSCRQSKGTHMASHIINHDGSEFAYQRAGCIRLTANHMMKPVRASGAVLWGNARYIS